MTIENREIIVREILDALQKRDSLRDSEEKDSSLKSPKRIFEHTTGSIRTTIGTAGKIFSGVPGDWKPFPKPAPIRWDENLPVRSGFCSNCAGLKQVTGSDLESMGADRISVCHPEVAIENHEIARIIDHTLLKAEATQKEIRGLCEEARRFCFASVCVNPCYVSLASQILKGSGVKVCAVVGFPLGANTSSVKAAEAGELIQLGADEIDMVMNIGALKSGKDEDVLDDLLKVRSASSGKILKVIIETALLSEEEKIKACKLAQRAGADFVKTSTGFSSGGATSADVQLIRETVGLGMGIKAAGGIKEYAFAKKLMHAGATRIGASASVSIVTGKKNSG